MFSKEGQKQGEKERPTANNLMPLWHHAFRGGKGKETKESEGRTQSIEEIRKKGKERRKPAL